MEWGIMEIGQLLLYIMALGIPTVWVTNWLYRAWRRANMPAILGMINRQRRRDATIKETRERAQTLETTQTEIERRLEALVVGAEALEDRVGKLEMRVGQLRQKLRSRGVLTDA